MHAKDSARAALLLQILVIIIYIREREQAKGNPMNRISVEIDEHCLQRLLSMKQVQVEELHCSDKAAKAKLQKMLLTLAIKHAQKFR